MMFALLLKVNDLLYKNEEMVRDINVV